MNNPPPLPPQQQVNSWERNTIEKLLLEVYRDRRRERTGRWVRFAILLFLLFLLFSVFSGDKKELSVAGVSAPHTAVISLSGVIDSNNANADKLIEGLEKAYENKQVKGIIIRADSPGGSPVIADVAYNELLRLRKMHNAIPVYVVAEDVCASGCYYIAAAADKIYANPASLVGSIGVISSSFGATELIGKIGVERRLKTAGNNKGMGDPFSPETPEQQAIWQAMLDDIHQQFINAVKNGRGPRLQWQHNDDVFSGRVYTGNEAKKIGLIDDFGNIYQVSRDVIGAQKMVDYTPKEDFSSLLGRRLGASVRQTWQTLQQPGW